MRKTRAWLRITKGGMGEGGDSFISLTKDPFFSA